MYTHIDFSSTNFCLLAVPKSMLPITLLLSSHKVSLPGNLLFTLSQVGPLLDSGTQTLAHLGESLGDLLKHRSGAVPPECLIQ